MLKAIYEFLCDLFSFDTYVKNSKNNYKNLVDVKVKQKMNRKRPFNKSLYDPHFYQSNCFNGINPATGLPMCGGVDTAGNPYGCDFNSLKDDFFK